MICGVDYSNEIVNEYKYMMKYERPADTPAVSYDSYERYVLTNNDTAA